jgi:hypothetical protein
MFDNHPKIETIGKDIWVYHNFLSESEISNIINKINETDESLWDCSHTEGHGRLQLMQQVGRFNNRVQDLLSEDLFVHHIGGVNRLSIGQSHGIHSDNHDFLWIREQNNKFIEEVPYKLVDDTVYGIVIYINDDYEGGEIFYTKQNITYKPKPGDLIIHSAEDHCEHGVNPVKTNVRYSISSSIRKKIKVNVDNV